MTEEKINGNGSRWRLNKDTISILVVVVVQTVTFTWFLAGQNSALNTVIKTVNEGQASAYTKADAVREREFQTQVQINLMNKADELMRRITILEARPGGVRP